MRLTKRGEKPKPTEKLAKAGHGSQKIRSWNQKQTHWLH